MSLVFGPSDTWETMAARHGVDVDTLFALNAGLGGCTTIQSVPVGQEVRLPVGATPPVDPDPVSAPSVVELPMVVPTVTPSPAVAFFADLEGDA